MAIQKTEKIWHNGKLIPWDNATLHVMSHVVHYGSSVFEGVRCYALPSGPAIFRAKEHMQRLLDSAKIYRIDVDFTVRRTGRRHGRGGEEQRSLALLHPSHCAARLRRSRRQPVQLADRGLHLQLSLGQSIWHRIPAKAPTSASRPGPASRPTPCPRWPSPPRTT